MPEHFIGSIEYRCPDEATTLREITCGCGLPCGWFDTWEEAIESYADHRARAAVTKSAHAALERELASKDLVL